MSLLEVRRGVLGGEYEESSQRVQTSRAPPSRVRWPAGGDPALPASAPGPRSRRSPGAEKPPARPPPAPRSREPKTPRGARRAQLPPPAHRPVSRRVLPSTGSPETWAPAGDPSAPEGHAPAAKTDPLLLPATLSSNQPPIPSLALRDCLLLSHHSCPDQESHARRL